MDKMPLIALLFQSIPEEIILFSMSSVLLGISLKWKRIVLIAVVSALASYFVRQLPIHFGVHMIIGVLFNSALIYFFLMRNLLLSLIISAIVLSALVIIENITIFPISMAFGLNGLQDIWSHPVLRIVITYPAMAVLGIITWILKKKNYVLFNRKDDF